MKSILLAGAIITAVAGSAVAAFQTVDAFHLNLTVRSGTGAPAKSYGGLYESLARCNAAGNAQRNANNILGVATAFTCTATRAY